MTKTTITAQVQIPEALQWLDKHKIKYSFDFNWPSSYHSFHFNNDKDAHLFALKWS